jgi:crossover junction endodeoxyribonuclease RuvC
MKKNYQEKNFQIILGIDPGTKTTGFGIIKKINNFFEVIDFGCITPKSSLHLHQRYLIIFNSIENLIKKYKPTSISVETQFVKKNVQIAIKLGMARGTCIIAAAKNNIPIYEYSPRKAKRSVTGNGGASKEQINKTIKTLLNLNEKIPEDAADALALAFCHGNQRF